LFRARNSTIAANYHVQSKVFVYSRTTDRIKFVLFPTAIANQVDMHIPVERERGFQRNVNAVSR